MVDDGSIDRTCNFVDSWRPRWNTYALSSAVGLKVDNYFEETLSPVICGCPETFDSRAGHRHICAPELLSHSPQPIDGAPPLTVSKNEAQSWALNQSRSTGNYGRAFIHFNFTCDCDCGHSDRVAHFSKEPLLELPRILENNTTSTRFTTWRLSSQ